MSKYIPFTTEQKERAASVDLEEFLRRRGEKLITSGRDKRLASDHSVTIRGNEWYDHAEEKGGTAISFIQRHYGIGYAEAVSTLLGNELGVAYPMHSEKQIEVKSFALPPANRNMHRVFAYLCKTPNEARCLPGTLEALRAEGVQIVILDSPEIYSEYAPYTYLSLIHI